MGPEFTVRKYFVLLFMQRCGFALFNIFFERIYMVQSIYQAPFSYPTVVERKHQVKSFQKWSPNYVLK